MRDGIISKALQWAPRALLVAATVLVSACATTEGTPKSPGGLAPPSQAAPETYAGMLARHGVGLSIPQKGKSIVVNIPSFELIAFQDGAPVLRSRVVVGRPATPTPELTSSIYAVRFNPSWMPTPYMMRYEGARFAPPGPHNPLGLILFQLDNAQLIFLHDTNDRSLFNLPERALSHGCIRVEQARAMAAWALGVSEGEIEAMIARGATYSVPLPEQIPTMLVYHTRFPDEGGQLVTHPDIYGRDRAGVAAGEEPGTKLACEAAR